LSRDPIVEWEKDEKKKESTKEVSSRARKRRKINRVSISMRRKTRKGTKLGE
jgi:hypothetical protein